MQTTTNDKEAKKYQPSVVARLRSLTPRRPLSFSEGVRIAELQAIRLLQLTGHPKGPVPESVITDLPRIDAQRSHQLISSGLTTWSGGQWRIRIKTSDPITRQRFTLAHELKHVLDAPHDDVIYSQLPQGEGRHRHIEAVCDAFAAAVLMPKAGVKQQWYAGKQDLRALAWHFGVSLQAMQIRMQNLGLIERQPHGRHAFELGHTAVWGERHHRHTRLHLRRSPNQRPHELLPSTIRCPHPALCPGGAL